MLRSRGAGGTRAWSRTASTRAGDAAGLAARHPAAGGAPAGRGRRGRAQLVRRRRLCRRAPAVADGAGDARADLRRHGSSRARPSKASCAIHRRVHGTLRETVGPVSRRHALLGRGPGPRAVGPRHAARVDGDRARRAAVAAHRGRARRLLRRVGVGRRWRSAPAPRTCRRPGPAAREPSAARPRLGHAGGGATTAARSGRRCCRRRSGRWRCRSRRSCGSSRGRGCRSAIRRVYGLSWTEADARRLPRVLQALRAARRLLPNRAARWPESRRT